MVKQKDEPEIPPNLKPVYDSDWEKDPENYKPELAKETSKSGPVVEPKRSVLASISTDQLDTMYRILGIACSDKQFQDKAFRAIKLVLDDQAVPFNPLMHEGL